MDGINAECLGLFFGNYNTAPGAEVAKKALTIRKYDLDRSPQIFVGRFAYLNKTYNTLALVAEVYMDGKRIEEFDGSRLPVPGTNGTVDVALFKWPNTAAANKIGTHEIVIKPGLHKGIMGGSHTFGLTIPETQWFNPITVSVNLTPDKPAGVE